MRADGREVVIVEAVRTPVGRGHPEKGYYRHTHPNELLGRCFTELLARTCVPAAAVEDVVCGCVQQLGEQMFNVARNAWLQAGLPSRPRPSRSTASAGPPSRPSTSAPR